MNNSEKSLKLQSKTNNIKKDFKQFFIQQTGSSVVKEAQFQQLSCSESLSSSGDFEVQDEEIEPKRIKTYQFWNGIKFPKQPPQIQDKQVQLTLSCPFSFGFNSLGRDNIIYIDNKICKAVGCLLIFNGQVYDKHNKKITTLAYNEQNHQLLSATQGPVPELFLWQYEPDYEDFQYVKRFSIGSKSEDIYSISFFGQNYVIAVEIFTLQKNSILHCFSKQDSKKLFSSKVGKFYDLQRVKISKQLNFQDSECIQNDKDRIFFANEEGIFQLVVKTSENNKQTFQLKKIHEDQSVCCLLPFQENNDIQVIYGDKNGFVNLVNAKQKIKVHDGWIFELKNYKKQQKSYFFGLGAMDFQLSVLEYYKGKFKIIRKIELGGYGRSIQSSDDSLLIGKRDGDYEEFSLAQLIQQKIEQIKFRKLCPSLKCFDIKDKKKQFFFEIQPTEINIDKPHKVQKASDLSKSFIYGHSKSKTIIFLEIQETSLENLCNYSLRYYPQALDFKKGLVAYIYFVERDQIRQISSLDISKSSKIKQTTINKSVLVIEEIKSKSALLKIPLKSEEQIRFGEVSVVVKYSPDGEYLALSDQAGNLFLLPINFLGKDLPETISSDKKMHKYPIRQIVWSNDSKFITTTSTTQLYYWNVKSQKDKLKLLNIKPNQVTQVLWTQLARYGWQTKDVWDHTDIANDIYKFWEQQHTKIQILEKKHSKEVNSQKQKIIACIKSNGHLTIYNYPAKYQRKLQIRITNQQFEICPYSTANNKFSFLVLVEGVIFLIELKI